MVTKENEIYLKTKFSGTNLYKTTDTEAEEDMDLSKSMLANSDAKVIHIRNNGLFKFFGDNSGEYFELKLGHEFDTTDCTPSAQVGQFDLIA